jgi:hypothetical protein
MHDLVDRRAAQLQQRAAARRQEQRALEQHRHHGRVANALEQHRPGLRLQG